MSEEEKKEEKDKAGTEGAPAEGEAAPDEEAQKKAKKKKMIIILAAAGLLVLVAGGAAGFFLLRGHGAEAEKQQAEASDKKNVPVYFSLGDQLVNLSGEGKRPNFLKVKVSLELADEKDLPLMESLKPRIIDNFQVYLRELRIDDLRGSAGMYRLREELLMRVTEAAAPVRIRDVLFQEMLVQ